ncbi:MAE_28990/MAE_18760 family HEPN-like nuclease [Sphingopyxis sp.]|uniref:MAE_28990/MAE_18760 family HEPN-like nuclease n=1 Tax=Sphingopyxis sp. TaxID=1908224 RepID=UPI002DF97C27|nr:MAE_28990/MAE_18760 family HEPN-like nuclease [Sphingopyxis sp.]
MTPETLLASRLQEDKTWRIRELSELVRACQDASGTRQEALLRAAIPVLYAHWEGYFVVAANSYLGFVSEKRVNVSLLKEEFWAISVRKRYKSNQISGEKNFARFLVSIRSEPDKIFKRGNFDRINGQSNLNCEVLDFCLSCIAIDGRPFDGYREFIDKELVDRRNHVAHGASLRFEPGTISDYRDKVVDLLRIVHNEIENAANAGAYLK